MLGCGVQARSHLQAFSDLFPIARIIAYGRGRANIDALCAMAAELGIEATVADGLDAALGETDIVVSSVTREPGAAPFVDAAALRPGVFAAITDLARPWLQSSLAQFERIIIDDRAQEAQMKDRHGAGRPDLGRRLELVLETVPARESDAERNAFVFRGFGLGDFALAALPTIDCASRVKIRARSAGPSSRVLRSAACG